MPPPAREQHLAIEEGHREAPHALQEASRSNVVPWPAAVVRGELAGAEGHDGERGDGEDELQDAEAEAPYRAGRPPEGRGPILWHPGVAWGRKRGAQRIIDAAVSRCRAVPISSVVVVVRAPA